MKTRILRNPEDTDRDFEGRINLVLAEYKYARVENRYYNTAVIVYGEKY